ncbi:MAG: DUF983 domain-containing protein [Acidimicrobiales bacterium]
MPEEGGHLSLLLIGVCTAHLLHRVAAQGDLVRHGSTVRSQPCASLGDQPCDFPGRDAGRPGDNLWPAPRRDSVVRVPISVRPRTLVWRGLRRRCGRCGATGIFRSYFELRDRCPRCGYRLERDEASFAGVWLLNYSFTILPLLGLMTYMVYLLANGRDVSVWWFVAAAAVIVVVLPIVLYPVAKSLWAAVDLAMRPLEPVEEAEAALYEVPDE